MGGGGGGVVGILLVVITRGSLIDYHVHLNSAART